MAESSTLSACTHAKCLVDVGLRSQVFVPTDAEYITAEDSYWSRCAKLNPSCVVRPRTAEEVAIAIKALASAGEVFALRSGGHTNWAGSNNIKGGVTIDLGLLDQIVFDEASETVRIGPGCRWHQVYTKLRKYGRVVAGAREGHVGVAGFLLGGGNSFFTAQKGFGCDQVIAFEVVLANGRIANANAQHNTDLFRVLKGGSNNFGVATDFTMNTIKNDSVWGGIITYSKHQISRSINAISSFTDDLINDPDSNLECVISYLPTCKDIVVDCLNAHVGGIEKAPAYSEWLEIPETSNTMRMTSISDMTFVFDVPSRYYDVWYTQCFRNDTRIMFKAIELHEKLVEDLKVYVSDGDFICQCAFQPLPTFFAQHSFEAGGNVLGVERHRQNGILFLATAMVRTPEQESFVKPKVEAWAHEVQQFAATVNGTLPWIYLNYADRSQGVLESYGSENIARMKNAAAKYDPEGVFQRLCPGGFKISNVVERPT